MNGSKDLKTIIYFKGVYDTLDLFTDHLIGAFEGIWNICVSHRK